jgi:mycothiol synthase
MTSWSELPSDSGPERGPGGGPGADHYTWRALGPEDLDAWVVLLAAIEAVDHEDEHFGAEDLREKFADTYRDFPNGSVAAFDGAAMVAYGFFRIRTAAEPVHEMWMAGAVHPDHRGRGLGSHLLAWVEETAVPLHERHFPGHPLTISAGCRVNHADAMELFAEHGYEQVRWFHGMAIDLVEELPAAAVPSDVVLVSITPERAEDARRVRNEAFLDHWGSTDSTPESWAHRMAESSYRPALSYLAYETGAGGALGEPLALVLCNEYQAVKAATGKRDLYIALVGTRRRRRKRGLATTLITHVLRQGQAEGFDSASLGVDAGSPTGALDLYERIGFRAVGTYVSQHLVVIPGPRTSGDAE